MKDKRKLVICVSIILGVFLVLFGGYLVLRDDNIDVSTNKLYTNVVLLDTGYKASCGEEVQLLINYPVINIEGEDIKNLNSILKTDANNLYYKYKDNLLVDYFSTYTYEYIESKDYLTVLRHFEDGEFCSGGTDTIDSVYVINKNSGNIMLQEEVWKYFGYNKSLVVDKYKIWLSQQYYDDVVLSEMENEVENSYVYIGINGNLELVTNWVNSGTLKVQFDGNNIIEVTE